MTTDHRRNVAVHEAGHVVAAQLYRARGVGATLTTDRRSRSRGLTTLRAWRGSDQEFLTYLLAGAAAGRLITGDAALTGSTDMRDAGKVLAAIGGSLTAAERQAAAFARHHRRQIERAAAVLYDHGHI